MKTDELIALLSTNVEPVDRRQLVWAVSIGVVLAAIVALCAALLTLGVRPDIGQADAVTYLVGKFAFSVLVVLLAAFLLIKLARPGGERTARPAMALLPFAGIILIAALNLALAPSSHWDLIVGDMWLECLISIPIIAILPFAVITWAVRRIAAPTDLVQTGAVTGLLAGGVSAMGYALHCTDDSLPFVALWYSGTIAFCTVAGALLGPRLLRW